MFSLSRVRFENRTNKVQIRNQNRRFFVNFISFSEICIQIFSLLKMVKFWIALSFWESKKYVVVDDDDNDNNDNNDDDNNNNDDDDSESDTWGSFAAFSRNTSLLSKTIRFTWKCDENMMMFMMMTMITTMMMMLICSELWWSYSYFGSLLFKAIAKNCQICLFVEESKAPKIIYVHKLALPDSGVFL